MLNENTLEELTDLMQSLANRVIRGNMGVTADLLCWTPLHHGFAPLVARRFKLKHMRVDCEKRPVFFARMQREITLIYLFQHGSNQFAKLEQIDAVIASSWSDSPPPSTSRKSICAIISVMSSFCISLKNSASYSALCN